MIPRLLPPIKVGDLPLAFLSRGSVSAFEAAFARLAKTKYAIAFPYGRTALLCLLEALGLNERKIICPSYTCVVVPHAVSYSNNEPVFVDCAEDSYLMDMELASEAVGTEPSALIATSLYGEPISVDAVSGFCREHPNVEVIQDCAHSFFCEDAGRAVHKHGRAAIYGLNISKTVTSVFGGMVTTDDEQLATHLRAIQRRKLKPATLNKDISRRLYFLSSRIALSPLLYQAVRGLSSSGLLGRFVNYYSEALIDMPNDYLVQLTDFEAAIGTLVCTRYHDAIAHRRMIAARYNDGMSDCEHLRIPDLNPGHTWSHYTVATENASKYTKAALRSKVELGRVLEYFIPDMPAYANHRHLDRNIARGYKNKILNLPVHMEVTNQIADTVISIMRVCE
ncbi:DegT/DnrJ/EryC1/StrS family aminotransferase [Luminiphilus sp.]|nr:DegT/DnrJ/EryC1/StrS family aminotransferase [Luminiphilus sp.]